MCSPKAVFHHLLLYGLQFSGFSFTTDCHLHGCCGPITQMLLLSNLLDLGHVLWDGALRWRGEKECKAFMRNVQTQAQTWASVRPYADYNEGLIVLTGREGKEEGGLQPQLSRVIAHHHRVKLVKSTASVYLERELSLPGEMKWHLHSLWGYEWFWSKDQIFLRVFQATVSRKYCSLMQLNWKPLSSFQKLLK